jgi:D-methionine transport system ATP-binding protein
MFSRKGIQQKVTTLLQLVGLEEKSLSYPHQLSGGQKQRVAIARALVTDPEVLLCDEATSSLDPETTAAILSLLKKINRELGITIVIITHEMEVIKQICHQVAVLDKGKIIEQKTMIDLFTNPETGLAKRLTNAAFHVELPSAIRNSLLAAPAENLFPVVKLSFVGEQSRKPLMAELMKQYEVASNILLADIETIDDVIVGVTICQLTGQDQAIQLALKYLKEQVKVEVLGYAQ